MIKIALVVKAQNDFKVYFIIAQLHVGLSIFLILRMQPPNDGKHTQETMDLTIATKLHFAYVAQVYYLQ